MSPWELLSLPSQQWESRGTMPHSALCYMVPWIRTQMLLLAQQEYSHRSIFPAQDHVPAWSNLNTIVLDLLAFSSHACSSFHCVDSTFLTSLNHIYCIFFVAKSLGSIIFSILCVTSMLTYRYSRVCEGQKSTSNVVLQDSIYFIY